VSEPQVGIVLLAAGASERYGAAKLALTIGDVPLLRRAALAAIAVSARVVVVTGADADRLAPLLDDLAVDVCFNRNWQSGIGDSIACGVARLRSMSADVQGVLIMLADQYRIGDQQLRVMLLAHAQDPQAIVAASYAGAVGVPCLFPARHFDALTRLHGPVGAQGLLREHAAVLRALPMPEAAHDIDTPRDYAAALAGGG